jgi:hypothetical protein
VIVELTVKVYPLDKVMHSRTVWKTCFANKIQILGGAIVFESSDLTSTIQTFESKTRHH